MKKTLLLLTFLAGFHIILMAQYPPPVGNLIYEDTLQFSPLSSWIDIPEAETNIWVTGKPEKEFFAMAHTGAITMVTDSSVSYSNNLNDYFTITIPWEQPILGEGILSFYHKFDTDTLTDGGIIEISYYGEPFINIKDDITQISTHFTGLYEDTIRGGEYGFSGRSQGWQYVELYWWWKALVKSSSVDDLVLRFRFISDDVNTSKEGWMIDDIVFRGYDLTGNVDNKSLTPLHVFPVPAKDYFFISNDLLMREALSVVVSDLSGRIVIEQLVSEKRVDISHLPEGFYIYRFTGNNNFLAGGKLIKCNK